MPKILDLSRAGAIWRPSFILPNQSSPSPIPPSTMPGLLLFLDGSNSSSVIRDGSNKVSQWNDLGPSALAMTQVTTANQPTYDPVKGTVSAPSAMANMTMPSVAGTKCWTLAVMRINFSQAASTDGSLAFINGNSRNPYINYARTTKVFGIQWRPSTAVNFDTNWTEGTDFPANQFFAAICWYDTTNTLIKGLMNAGTMKSQTYTGTPTTNAGSGTLMDFRTGWTDMGIRALAVGSDLLSDSQAQGLLTWAIQQAQAAN